MPDSDRKLDRLICEAIGIPEHDIGWGIGEAYPNLTSGSGMLMLIEAMRAKFQWTIIIDGRIGMPMWVRIHQPADRVNEDTNKIERYDSYRGSSTHTELPLAVRNAAAAALGIEVPK